MKNSLSKISNARSNFTNNFSSHSPRSLNSRPEHNAAKTPKKHTTVVCGDISSILVVLNLKSEKKRRNKFRLQSVIQYSVLRLPLTPKNVTSLITCFHTRMENFNILCGLKTKADRVQRDAKIGFACIEN